MVMETTQDEPPTRQLYDKVSIPRNSRCIRLLDLDYKASTSNSWPLTASLRVVDLDTNPDFISLSYEWHPGGELGENNDPESRPLIFCAAGAVPSSETTGERNSDAQFPIRITRNCHSALSHIRQHFQAPARIAIWVDAICINQLDGREKEHQIPLMCDIYSKATSVYAWPGDGDDNTDRAMRRLRRLGRVAKRLPVETLKNIFRCEYEHDEEASLGAADKYRRRVWLDVLGKSVNHGVWKLASTKTPR